MTRSEIIIKVARQTGIGAAQVELVLDSIVDNIVDSLRAGDKVTIAGFGRFEMRERKTKAYTNPKTKVSSQLAPTSIPGFKASGLMKQRIAKKK
ncbi:HU family DNA-binding protein [Ruminococcaceae bacterium OttesenSCG-928-A16]|nr:HU family DNA-binding protein [Ruminococcaceae bacterium OttesenSCG-928-A16]